METSQELGNQEYHQKNNKEALGKLKAFRKEMMTLEEVLTCLCVFDSRSPLYYDGEEEEDEEERQEKCFCDNCFTGKTKLAEFTLTLMEY